MNRIDAIFTDLRSAKRKALMPFICGGHPSRDSTKPILAALGRGGAHIVEVGFPFSDPIADGPIIAAAMHEALSAGVTPVDVLNAVADARRDGLKLGLIAMVSISIVHRMGARALVSAAKEAGFDGFIFPDAPLEESEPLTAAAREAGLSSSLLIAPTTPPARMERIARACSGFIYLLARVGITGDSAGAANQQAIDVTGIRDRVRLLRGMTNLPIACGFGISSADHVRAVVRAESEGGAGADAAIVGSALVKRLTRAASQRLEAADEAESFTRALATGLA